MGDINEILLRKVPCEIRHIVTKCDAVDDALMNSFAPPTHTSQFSLPPTKYPFLCIPAYDGWNLFSFEWQLNRAFDKK